MGLTGIHHTHVGGEWMVGYRFMSMKMDGNLDGTSRVSDAEVLSQYAITPTSMNMQMHMIDIMYAPRDNWTFMFMLPYVSLSMNHRTGAGVRFRTRSEGIGDLKLSGLYSVWRRDTEELTNRLVVKGGVGLPTGSISAKDRTPMGSITLPYPMQLGSGSFDLLPGITYLGQTDRWSWGSNLSATLRVRKNRKDYQLGNRGELSLWTARKVTNWLSSSLRIDGQVWGNIHGSDDRLKVGNEFVKCFQSVTLQLRIPGNTTLEAPVKPDEMTGVGSWNVQNCHEQVDRKPGGEFSGKIAFAFCHQRPCEV